MRIGINALFMIPGQHGGTETYLRNLVESLSKVDTSNEYILFSNSENAGSFDLKHARLTEVPCKVSANFRPLRVLWEQAVLPLLVRKHRIDVLHSPAYTTPLLAQCASVVTIHDLLYLHYPESCKRGQLFFFKHFVPLSARTADKVLAVSYSTKRDLEEFLGVSPDQIVVIHEAPDDRFQTGLRQRAEATIKSKYGISPGFVLSMSTFNPNKNLPGLLKAISLLRKKYSVTTRLAMVGMQLKYRGEIERIIDELGIRDSVHLLGYVPDDDVPLFYSLADVLVFPSFFEGFGLPPLEAMACGCPVVCADTSSLPEVVGDAAILCDPHNIDEMAEAVYRVLTDRELRDTLVKKGFDRAEQFSWEKAAAETIRAYGEAYRVRHS